MYTQFHPRSPKTTQESAEGRNVILGSAPTLPLPRSSQIGVDFSDQASIGVGLKVLVWLNANCQLLFARFSKTLPAQAGPHLEAVYYCTICSLIGQEKIDERAPI
jgi:hypothetical protein